MQHAAVAQSLVDSSVPQFARSKPFSPYVRNNLWIWDFKARKPSSAPPAKGLGKACAIALAREGVELVITARTASALEQTAAEIRQLTGTKVTAGRRRHHQ